MSKQIRELFPVFFFGAFSYGAIEILWRGFTHPTMLFLGGLCLAVIYTLEKSILREYGTVVRSFIYAVIITAAELVCGILLNIILKMHIWDYSKLPCNFLGQVCLDFFLLWFALSLFCCFLCRLFRFVYA